MHKTATREAARLELRFGASYLVQPVELQGLVAKLKAKCENLQRE